MGGSAAKVEPGQDKPEEKGEKLEKGGDKDCSDGPVEKRGCTDVLWCLLFILHWIALLGLFSLAVQNGNPTRLVNGRDWQGNVCGIDSTDGGVDLKDYPLVYYSLNVTASLDKVGEKILPKKKICATSCAADENACDRSDCAGCDGCGLDPAQMLADAQATANAAMADPAGAASGLMGGASGGNSLVRELTKYFNPICVKKCPADSPVTPRTTEGTWRPSDPAYQEGWAQFQQLNIGLDAFNLPALGADACPYSAKYCVPFPGLPVSLVGGKYCVPQVVAQAAQAGADAAQEVVGAIPEGFTEELESGVGNMFGDLSRASEAIATTCVVSLVVGIAFLVLLRWFLGPIVWITVIGTIVMLFLGSSFVYLKTVAPTGCVSGEMNVESASQVAAANVADLAGCDEGARLLAAELAAEARRLADTADELQATADALEARRLSANETDGDDVEAAKEAAAAAAAAAGEKAGEAASAAACEATSNVDVADTGECAAYGGWEISDCEPDADGNPGPACLSVKYSAFFLYGLTGLWLIFVLCMLNRIKLAIAINQVACLFVVHTPTIIVMPFLQIVGQIVWMMIWIIIASFVASYIPDGHIPFRTTAQKLAEVASGGVCTMEDRSGCLLYAYVEQQESYTDAMGATQDYTMYIPRNDPNPYERLMVGSEACAVYDSVSTYLDENGFWGCSNARYNLMSINFWFCVFSLFWNNAMNIALGQMIVAGSCCIWYFTPNDKKGTVTAGSPIPKAAKNAIFYHLGTMAFGAFILAVVQTFKWFLRYLAKQAKAQQNKVMAAILTCLAYLIACFEKCVKFLNKNAYIQTALLGTKFCTSAKNALMLILRNAGRIGVLGLMGILTNFLGKVVITAGTAVLGYFILNALNPNDLTSIVAPCLIFVMIGYCVGTMVMSVFAMSVDTVLQCFVADEELAKGSDRKHITPSGLAAFLPEKRDDKGGCCWCCAKKKGGDE